MGGAVVNTVNYADVQGLVRFGFVAMTEACYVLVKIKNAAAARTWLSGASERVTTAVERKPAPPAALQIAFTRGGLEALQVPGNVVAGFSSEFLGGMTGDGNRSRRLGDTGTNSPKDWEWGAGLKTPDAVVMLFAEPGKLEAWRAQIENGSWGAAFEEIQRLTPSDIGGREPFGFIDGTSQPDLDWDQARKVSANRDQLSYGNVVCLGEFLLGYSNEYGRFTDRPVLGAGDHGSEELDSASDRPGKDLGKNGTYLVIRQLQQDVRGFWQFLDKAAGGNRQARYQLAEAMVGRRIEDGAPLVPLIDRSIPGVGTGANPAKRKMDVENNQFTYDSDAMGIRCPLGAHIRRGNPRTPDIQGNPTGIISHLIRLLGFGNPNFRGDLVASTRFHRLLRRGREYGPKLTPEEALQPAFSGDPQRGLHFVAINANIQRQFEFVQNAWIMRTKFNGLSEESDPLLGNREAVPGCPFTDAFSLPQENSVGRRILDIPQFVTVRGGAYFFLPGIRALKYLSKAGG